MIAWVALLHYICTLIEHGARGQGSAENIGSNVRDPLRVFSSVHELIVRLHSCGGNRPARQAGVL